MVPFPMIGNTVRETDLGEQAMRGVRVWCGQIKVNMLLGHSSRYDVSVHSFIQQIIFKNCIY